MKGSGHQWRRAVPGLAILVVACVLAEGLATPAARASAPSPAAVGIQPGDVPGYSPVSATLTSLTSTTLPAALRQCGAGSPLLAQIGVGPASTISVLYGQGEGPFGVPALLVGTAVLTDGSTADAQQAFALLDSSTLQACWLSTYGAITTAMTSGLATLLTASRSALPPLTLGKGAQSTGFVFAETASMLGETVRDTIEITVLHVGTMVTLLFTLATNESFPEPVRTAVARAVAERMGASPATSTTPATPTPGPTTAPRSCRRPGIPEQGKPVLADAQVGGIVHVHVRFTVEITGTDGSSTCVWTETTRSRPTGGSTRPQPAATTWRVLLDGPLHSAAAAHKVYVAAGAAASVKVAVTHLGDAAELVSGAGFAPAPSLLVRAGRYYLAFSSASARSSPTTSAVLQGLAAAVLVRLGFTPSHSHKTLRRKQWSSDWANGSFCKSYGQPVLATFRGVASCGQPYVNRSSNTSPRPICYPVHTCRPPGVLFDATGFQCVEYADRYFYYVTGVGTFPFDPGSDTAEALYYKFHATNRRLGLVPPGVLGGTSTFQPSLKKGDLISMWRPGFTRSFGAPDPTGHVAIVTSVHVEQGSDGKYSGHITMINENAQHGITAIEVRTNVLSYGGGYFTRFQWLTGLPTS